MIRETAVNYSENRAERKSGGITTKRQETPAQRERSTKPFGCAEQNGVNNKIERRNEV